MSSSAPRDEIEKVPSFVIKIEHALVPLLTTVLRGIREKDRNKEILI